MEDFGYCCRKKIKEISDIYTYLFLLFEKYLIFVFSFQKKNLTVKSFIIFLIFRIKS